MIPLVPKMPAVKCPHCPVSYDYNKSLVSAPERIEDARGFWFLIVTKCPSCENFRIAINCSEKNVDKLPALSNHGVHFTTRVTVGETKYQRLVYPFPVTRPLPDAISEEVRRDFNDAVAILEISPRLSAAASRRCMQTIIRQQFHISKRTLFDEIEALKISNKLQSKTVEILHALRTYGNFGAHPIEGNAGEIIDVEPGEAQAMIMILELLVDEAYVRPAQLQSILDKVEKKTFKKSKQIEKELAGTPLIS